MKRLRYLMVTSLLCIAGMLHADVLRELAERISPELAYRVRFSIDASETDITVAPGDGEVISITAPDTRLAAAGLGCYLRDVAQAHWSWCGNRLAVPMPVPTQTYTYTPAFTRTVAYNYCTLSYTMAFWGKEEWRAELDRLALYGFEMPLVQAGLPKVWQLTLRELGYPEDRINAFIPDEAAAAWWNMGNLEGLGGPLSQERIDGDAELGRYIVAEAKALGMKPILQGFVGLLPHDLPQYLSKTEYADAKFVNQGRWVDGFVRPTLLLPNSETYAKIAAIWYKNLLKVYGVESADAFAGDLFHEGGSTAGVDVTACARAVQAAQQKASPGAIWVIQAWHGNPRAELLAGLNPKYALIEALVKDQANGQNYNRSFQGVPWVWCELLNFGGNHGLYGGMEMLTKLGDLTKQPGASTMVGFGLLSEGLETNPIYYEFFTEHFFMPKDKNFTKQEYDAWLARYAQRRYGVASKRIVDALKLMSRSVYRPMREQEGCTESIACAKPSWTARKASSWASGDVYYSAQDTLKAALQLANAAKENPKLLQVETFRYDLADFTRQALSDLARPVLAQGKEGKIAPIFLDAIRYTDKVLACEPRWTLKWREDIARRTGGDAAAMAIRRMYTTWSGRGGALNDYAHRQLAGLMRDYYLKRWEIFFNAEAERRNPNAELNALNDTFLKEGVTSEAEPAELMRAVREALVFAVDVHKRWPEAFTFATGVPWKLNGVRGPTKLEFSVSEYITRAGVYELKIQYQSGRHALKIESVELFEGEKKVAEDVHAGYTGIRTTNNVYQLRVEQLRAGLEDYVLRINCSGDGGGNSSGIFTLKFKSAN
jgi:alpha-N-acetylglucosaminidase